MPASQESSSGSTSSGLGLGKGFKFETAPLSGFWFDFYS